MQTGQLIDDRFEIIALAGAGGMSQVFQARDRRTGVLVAVKVLSEHKLYEAERLTREAEVLEGLDHPNIVRHVAHGLTPDGRPFLAMEWLEGENLSHRLAQGRMEIPDTLRLMKQVASALACAHARGLVHRDLKPSNLFLPGGRIESVKLLDFGLVRFTAAALSMTQTGMLIGTPKYMAPEQARLARDLDARADLFSLGCILFECLAGRPAFEARHPMAVLAKILMEEAPRVSRFRPGVPEPLEMLAERMLSKEPRFRPRDGAALLAELEALGPLNEDQAGPAGRPRPSLTIREQRLLSVVLVGAMRPAATAAGQSPGSTGYDPELLELVRVTAGRFGGQAERLADGSLIVSLAGEQIATDEAAQAARCALALKAILPDRPLAVKTGRGESVSHLTLGEVIDRAAHMLRPPEPAPPSGAAAELPPILVDSVTAGLLNTRFELIREQDRFQLRGEREPAAVSRTLMGKPTPCIGRDRELASLQALWQESAAEPMARAVLGTGPAGVGKSRLRQELVQRLQATGAPLEVWIGRADPIRAGVPFGMIGPVIRRLSAIQDGDSANFRRLKLRVRLSRTLAGADLARVSEFLGEIAGVNYADDSSVQLRAARQNPVLMGDQMRRAWVDWLSAETRRQPVLLILEDLQWGDQPSLRLVDAALQNLSDHPFMVLALARPEIDQAFPQLWATRRLEEIRLTELSRKASERLARTVLGPEAPAGLVEHVAGHSGGNPFFLEELIRTAAEDQSGALPETVLAMMESRLDGLEPEVRRLLRAGSVFGLRFGREGLALLLGQPPEAALDAQLRELTEKELLTRLWEEPHGGGEHYAFRHALLREAVYATLTETDRLLGHRLAADWLEEAGRGEPGVLAEHFERAAQPQRAVRYFLLAAEQELRGNDFGAALARAARAEACGAAGVVLGQVQLTRAEAHHWRGEAAEAEHFAAAAMRLLETGSRPWYTAAALLATTAGRLAHHDHLVRLAGELTMRDAIAAERQNSALVAMASTAVALMHAGKLDLADGMMFEIWRRPEYTATEDVFLRAWTERVKGIRAAYAGDSTESLRQMEASARHFEQAGDLRTACQQWGNVGYVMRELGLHAEAENALRGVLEKAGALGLHHIVPTAKHNLAMALAFRGDLADAGRPAEEAAATFARQGDRRFEGTTRIYLSRIQILRGDPTAPEAESRRAIEVLSELAASRSYALAALAQAEMARGRLEEGARHAREAGDLLRSVKGIDEGETFIQLVEIEACLACGETGVARRLVVDALERLQERAARIGEPAWQETFLTAIPEHARIMALSRELPDGDAC